jgi:hypothetical protein
MKSNLAYDKRQNASLTINPITPVLPLPFREGGRGVRSSGIRPQDPIRSVPDESLHAADIPGIRFCPVDIVGDFLKEEFPKILFKVLPGFTVWTR